eukprot:snap_masked-scaffold_32-processed-gene-0.25-mRNA-1 protein AED:1.00 eAED:1.00 QI:0/-1/0/0/-1/1/1/0/296
MQMSMCKMFAKCYENLQECFSPSCSSDEVHDYSEPAPQVCQMNSCGIYGSFFPRSQRREHPSLWTAVTHYPAYFRIMSEEEQKRAHEVSSQDSQHSSPSSEHETIPKEDSSSKSYKSTPLSIVDSPASDQHTVSTIQFSSDSESSHKSTKSIQSTPCIENKVDTSEHRSLAKEMNDFLNKGQTFLEEKKEFSPVQLDSPVHVEFISSPVSLFAPYPDIQRKKRTVRNSKFKLELFKKNQKAEFGYNFLLPPLANSPSTIKKHGAEVLASYFQNKQPQQKVCSSSLTKGVDNTKEKE